MMNQKLYYRILAFGLSGYIIYSLMNFLFFKCIGISTFNIEQFKFLFPLFIIINETRRSKKPYSIINYCLFPIILIGYTFKIMHWPFGLEMFLGSLFIILCSLFFNALKGYSNKSEKIIILLHPTTYFIAISFLIFRFPSSIWFLLDFIIMGVTAIFLFIWQKKMNK